MKVADLCQSLEGLCQFLESSGAKQTANQWRRLKEALTAFAEPSVTDFCDFLVRAEEYRRTGTVAIGKRPRVPAKKSGVRSPEALARAAQELKQFYESVTSADVTYEKIADEVKRIDRQFKADEVKELARAIGISIPPKTKKAALEAIHRALRERKESYERTRF